MIPFEYEAGRHCTTPFWTDPRTEDGELAWAERFGAKEMAPFKRQVYLWAGQYMQRPAPRGGGIFKEEWWQAYEVPPSRAYDFQPIFVLASLDTAFKEKQEDDYSALTVWAVYDDDKTKNRRIMLVDAWKRRLPLHGVHVPRGQNEKEQAYLQRAMREWGLCEWVNYTCTRRRVHRLIVEDSARGHDVNAEIRRLFGARDWGVHLIPARGDKVSRANAVVDMFTDHMIYAPGEYLCFGHDRPHCKMCPDDQQAWRWRDWANMVVTDMSVFPKGAHDDIVDASVYALKHLREIGLAIRRDERAFAEEQLAKQRPKPGVASGYFS
jgi:phage terminase large subunit-like protein